tara:strand:+ start:8090 stop:8296 length:207 start_codon:yes stop_codon:yes gene_type:complete
MSIFQNFLNKFNFFSTGKSATEKDVVEVAASTDYSSMKVVELKAEAKARGLTGYSSLKKAELIKLLGD